MALNKTYWDYDHAQSVDWATYGVKYANKQIYANPNFSWGNLDYSFPTSFRKRNITRLKYTGNGQSQACETIPDCLIYNSMIAYTGNGATGSFYKDNYYSYYSAGNEGYFPVIDIDTHDFAFKMTLALFSNGNWITVNAVDFVNNYDSYAANVYGYINNYMETFGSRYTFCNYYVTPDSQFSVHANMYGYRTSGYGSVNLGGHAVSGQTAWNKRSIWQVAATTAGNYSNLSYPANSYFPFEIPELNGQSWNAGNEVAPDAIITGGIYTNHAVLTYNDQRVYMPLKHILKDIIVNCGLVLLDSEDNKWISMVDANGLCQDKLVLLSSDEAKESSIYNTRTSDNNLNPSPTPPGPGGDDPSDDQAWGGAYSGAGAFSKFYLCTATDLANLRTWFGGGGSGDQIPDGFDPMGQVLGLLQYPVSISGTALAPEEIVFRSGKTIVHTGVNADRSTGGFLHLDCGSVEIPRRMQERGVPFLDFETSLEIYVPFCGTAPLDVQTCVGQTLTCDIYVATATGDVSAVIAAGGHPVAYMSGNMAESLPISSSGYGMYLAACKSTWGNGVSQTMNQLTGGATSTIKNTNQAALNETLSYTQTGGWGHSELIAESYNNPAVGRAMGGLASAKGAAALGLATTAVNAIGTGSNAYEQYQRVKNASYTSVSGSFTSCAAWNYPFTPYVKITRPHQQIPQGDHGSYKHTAGIPLVETKTLSGAPGLTTCVNPDVSGIANATAQEKDIIYRALVNGVIV